MRSGIVGHEMLCGAKPFDKPTPIATAMSHIHEEPPPLPDDVPEDLAGVIEHLLAKDPRDRPENARAVAIRLGLADHEIIGLALGLAQAVYGESTLDEVELGPPDRSEEPTATMAVDAARSSTTSGLSSASVGTASAMTDNSDLRDDDQADEAVQAVVDRVLSWQAGAPPETVLEELQAGLARDRDRHAARLGRPHCRADQQRRPGPEGLDRATCSGGTPPWSLG